MKIQQHNTPGKVLLILVSDDFNLHEDIQQLIMEAGHDYKAFVHANHAIAWAKTHPHAHAYYLIHHTITVHLN